MLPVMSLLDIIGAVVRGIVGLAVSRVFGPEVLFDCRPIGVGEVIEDVGSELGGVALESAGDCVEAGGSLEF